MRDAAMTTELQSFRRHARARHSQNSLQLGSQLGSQQGTTLLELVFAVVLFTIISGVAFSLMYQQQNSSQGTQGQVALNMALRSTESLLQMDLANAGNGYYQIQGMGNNALGVSINNNVVPSGGTCTWLVSPPPTNPMLPTKNYGSNCFDQLTVLSYVDPSLGYATPVLNPVPVSPATTVNVHTSSSVVASVPTSYTGTFAQAVAAFNVGDYLLFLTNDGPASAGSSFPAYTVVKITSIASSSANSTITFGFTPTTNSNGSNSMTSDPFNLSTCDGAATCPTPSVVNAGPPADNFITASFAATDYILKLVPVSYQVCNGPGTSTVPASPTVLTGALYSCDQTANSPDIANPKLWRTMKSNATQGTPATPAGCSLSGSTGGCCPANYVCSVVMEQILGFKVGASIWNAANPSNTDVPYYNYDASSYSINTAADQAFNFGNLVSVRVSIIGRTAPAITQNYVYKNNFDGGPYQVQGMALVVNPRNLNQQNY